MSGTAQILIVGSLPPTPSSAAPLTHMLATRLQQSGVQTCVLVDEMSVPPKNTPYNVIRPFDHDIRTGKFDAWPRLYVLGNEHDSLAVANLLEVSPGAAIVATNSLFDLARTCLSMKEDGEDRLFAWLSEQHGRAGKKLFEAISHHRRHSDAISEEISGYDLVLSQATTLIPLSTGQQAEFKRLGLPCHEPENSLATPSAKARPREKDSEFLIIGMEPSGQALLQDELAGHAGINCRFMNRFAAQTFEALQSCTGLVVMDGHDAANCPLVAEAIAAGKPVICANQLWLADLPRGRILPISHANAYHELVHAIFHTHYHWRPADMPDTDADKPIDFISVVMEVASTSQPLRQLRRPELDVSSSSHPAETAPADAEGAWPLIGAVPGNVILSALMPGLDIERSPRFLTPALANYLSELVEEPVLRLPDYLGFENPMVDADESELPSAAEKKRMPWNAIAKGLLTDNRAIAFGCSVNQAHAPAETPESLEVNWSFKLPATVLDKKGPVKEYDRETSIFWKYDGLRLQVIMLFMTGSSGTVSLSTGSETAFLVSDGHSTQVISNNGVVDCNAPASGVACLKFAAIPDEDGTLPDIRSILTIYGVTLGWKRS